jgi:chaperonin GroES
VASLAPVADETPRGYVMTLVVDNTSGIVPLDHRVLVLHDPVEEKIGSIILPDSERDKQKYAMTNATVIAVGALAWSEAKHDARQFGIDTRFPEAGSRVKVGRYTGDQHKGSDGKEYTILNDSDVIALLTEG